MKQVFGWISCLAAVGVVAGAKVALADVEGADVEGAAVAKAGLRQRFRHRPRVPTI